MMKALACFLLGAILVSASFAHDPATEMAEAANRFIASLDDKAKKAAFREAGIGVAETPSEMADTLMKMM